MKKTITLLLISAMILTALLGGCQQKEPEKLHTDELALQHETEFGGVYLKMTIDQFNALGFQYGDSVDVTFSNSCEPPIN